ncbi:competence type IV pilus minor pilin ComGE [Streptococcus pyogenes]
MVVIKNRKIKAYILLESLLTLAIFAMITSLLLSAINQGRRQQMQDYQEQEALNVAKMAVQTGQNELTLNGVQVHLVRDERSIRVYHDKKEILNVEKK